MNRIKSCLTWLFFPVALIFYICWLALGLAGLFCSFSIAALRRARQPSLRILDRCRKAPLPLLIILASVGSASASSSAVSFSGSYDRLIQQSVNRWWPDWPFWLDWKAQLYQESQLDPGAISASGARGLAQFMPGTWAEVSRQLGYGIVSPHIARYAIDAGAYYMASLRRQWSSPRPAEDRQRLAQASYNTGMGNMLHAQRLCSVGRSANSWTAIALCLPRVTGAAGSSQTITYVERIAHWRGLMEMQR